ncbi:MAG: hypothetical protein HN566_12715 [Polaribacter sp.]|jgi:hypothetical protein|nr:hypothetical protein [Polaribacter sp.]
MKRKLLNPELKWFMWLEDRGYSHRSYFIKSAKSNQGLYPYAGPRYTEDVKLIGRSNWHNESEILSMQSLSSTHRKRIPKMRVGTILKIEYLSLDNYLHLKLMSEDEVKAVNDWVSLNNELDGVNEMIKKAVPELLRQKNKLSAKIAKEKKRLAGEGVI